MIKIDKKLKERIQITNNNMMNSLLKNVITNVDDEDDISIECNREIIRAFNIF
jgi:hypothetical protein